MIRIFRFAPFANLPRAALLFAFIAGLGLAGCDDTGGDPNRQIGANPPLPAP